MITDTWQLQEAKNKLSELLERARARGPQTITRRGQEVAVVLSAEEYKRLCRPSASLVDFLRSSPLVDLDLDFERDRDTGREIEL